MMDVPCRDGRAVKTLAAARLAAATLAAAALGATALTSQGLAAPPAKSEATKPKASQPKAGSPQSLPLDSQWCLGDASTGPCILLEVARTSQQQMWGLQLRPALPALRGMLFPFSPAQPVKFWMHRTPAPLDMVFVHSGQVIAIEANVPPCMHLPCRSYGPDAAVDGVIELGAGQSKALGIKPGSPAVIRPATAPRG